MRVLRFVIPFAVFAVLVVFLARGLYRDPREVPSPLIDKAAPSFTLPQLDARVYWQIHRGTIVRSDAVAAALRDESGRVQLKLRQRPELLSVSRLYAHLFKAM